MTVSLSRYNSNICDLEFTLMMSEIAYWKIRNGLDSNSVNPSDVNEFRYMMHMYVNTCIDVYACIIRGEFTDRQSAEIRAFITEQMPAYKHRARLFDLLDTTESGSL